MIDSYSNTSQEVVAGGNISFAINSIQTGCTATHSAGSTTFSLNKPGFYFVTFNGTGAITGATAGTIIVSMLNNGTLVPGATASVSSASTTDVRSLAFSKLIQVKPSCCAVNNTTNLTFNNTGLAATFTNVNVVITKIA